jgi:hypothetical protein
MLESSSSISRVFFRITILTLNFFMLYMREHEDTTTRQLMYGINCSAFGLIAARTHPSLFLSMTVTYKSVLFILNFLESVHRAALIMELPVYHRVVPQFLSKSFSFPC